MHCQCWFTFTFRLFSFCNSAHMHCKSKRPKTSTSFRDTSNRSTQKKNRIKRENKKKTWKQTNLLRAKASKMRIWFGRWVRNAKQELQSSDDDGSGSGRQHHHRRSTKFWFSKWHSCVSFSYCVCIRLCRCSGWAFLHFCCFFCCVATSIRSHKTAFDRQISLLTFVLDIYKYIHRCISEIFAVQLQIPIRISVHRYRTSGKHIQCTWRPLDT